MMAAPIIFVALLGSNLHNSPSVHMIQNKLTLIRCLTSIIAAKETHLPVHSSRGSKLLQTF